MKNECLCPFTTKKAILFISLLFFILISFTAGSQSVTGKVSDETGQPLQGVSVTVKSTKAGTATDAGGNYTINARTNDTLVFSSMGFVNKELKVDGRSVVNAVLSANVQN